MEDDILSAANFLPNLPKSNLDDREFDDLVRECLLRIPRYCPEWTNYNPGDPGITLVELFSWLVHQMLYRFNQVPRRYYVAFLELLGIRLNPPMPASTELTFYLTKEQPEPKLIRLGTEVATERTENQEAIVFTTDRDLIIGQPAIKHLLRADRADSDNLDAPPDAQALVDPFQYQTFQGDNPWQNFGRTVPLFSRSQIENCFYVVLEPCQPATEATDDATENDNLQDNRIEGNVLAVRFTGPSAVTTGVMPDNPPLRWQAWNGDRWQDGILRQRTDDRTRGFSFDRLGNTGPNPDEEGADVILHLPRQWPRVNFGDYEGHWIRCVYYQTPSNALSEYQRSPEITGISVRSLGGTVMASECIRKGEELLGISNGKDGQQFELEGPVLTRTDEEHIRIRRPDGEWENDWREVEHFGDSTSANPHYLIDSQSGLVQFGPLVREPSQLQMETRKRGQLQSWGQQYAWRPSTTTPANNQVDTLPAKLEPADRDSEHQYGRVPPIGSEIYITRYRVGGGGRGNVQAGKINVLKTAIPYVKRVVNYAPATGGVDAESLDQAVMRVPAILRTRETALTPEEFERRTLKFVGRDRSKGRRIHRAHCITSQELARPGVVYLIVIPHPKDPTQILPEWGLHPNELILDSDLCRDLQEYLNLHKALGIRVKPDSPEYIGVQVTAQVVLHDQYRRPDAQIAAQKRLCTLLYEFFNPITGGPKGRGWPLGRPARKTDVISRLQDTREVQYVGDVQLHTWQRNSASSAMQGTTSQWVMTDGPREVIPLRPTEIVCSWGEANADANNRQQTGPNHRIIVLEP